MIMQYPFNSINRENGNGQCCSFSAWLANKKESTFQMKKGIGREAIGFVTWDVRCERSRSGRSQAVGQSVNRLCFSMLTATFYVVMRQVISRSYWAQKQKYYGQTDWPVASSHRVHRDWSWLLQNKSLVIKPNEQSQTTVVYSSMSLASFICWNDSSGNNT